MADPTALRVAYVLQTGVPETDVVSGPLLHINAVIDGLRLRGHSVRVFMPREGRLGACDALDGSGWEPATFRLSRNPLFRIVERPIRRVQAGLRLPYLNLFDSIRYADGASRALAGADLIFERFGFMGYGGLLTAARLGIPSILEVNGDVPKEMEVLGVDLRPAQRRLSEIITRRTLSAATGIVCVAAALKERLVDRMDLDPDRIEVISNGADVSLFRQPQDVGGVRKGFELPCRSIVTFVGSFQPWHGVELLLDAFARVLTASDAELLLVGEGPGRAAAEQQARASGLVGRVRFLGRMSNANVARLLAASDVAVVPFPNATSQIVGSPLKIFEYMAAGRAIVASSAPIHDAIEHEITGLRVRPADPDALSQGILRLLGDAGLRQQLGANARRVALDRYSWEHTAAHLEAWFRTTLDRFMAARRGAEPRPLVCVHSRSR